MILGIGLDVCDVARIARLIGPETPPERAERFLARCFTSGERAYCDAVRDRATRYAARFAAKEAVAKALGAPEGVRWTDIEVVRGRGAPRVVLTGVAESAAQALGVARVHLTLTHDAGVAAAAVVLEGRGTP